MSNTRRLEFEQESPVKEAKQASKWPPMYRVVMLNDDFTPMDFVIGVLQKFFGMDFEKATQVMLQVHLQGKAVCGIYSKDVALTKVSQVNQFARAHEHPLMCDLEEN